MTSKKFLSKKKTAQQTISISPALKDWIERHVSVMRKKNPNDERYKSVSSFYCNVMEKVLKIFEKNKTLDDFDRLQDTEIEDFFGKLSANIFIPFLEPSLNMNRYTKIDFEMTKRYFMSFLRFMLKNMDTNDSQSIDIMFERFQNRYMASGMTKSINLEFNAQKDKKKYIGTIEHVGLYKNLHYINCKMFAETMGLLGVKVVDCIYSPTDLYYRLGLESTDLFFSKERVRKERFELMDQNVSFLTNYNRIVNDKPYYLWMRMAEDNDTFINFKNERTRDKWFKRIEEDLQKYGSKDEFNLNVLRFLERLHWIRLENEKEMSFRIDKSIESKEIKQFLLNYLSRFSNLIQNEGIFYLK